MAATPGGGTDTGASRGDGLRSGTVRRVIRIAHGNLLGHGDRSARTPRWRRLTGRGATVGTLSVVSTSEITIRPIEVDDAGQVLAVQRAAFVTEALIYDSPDMGPLTQTLTEVEYELRDNLGYVAVSGDRIVGAARAVASAEVLLIGRIAIAPDQQGAGIGPQLLAAVEARGAELGCVVAELFTGSLSADNLALYERLGYRESTRIPQDDGTEQVFLRKPLRNAD